MMRLEIYLRSLILVYSKALVPKLNITPLEAPPANPSMATELAESPFINPLVLRSALTLVYIVKEAVRTRVIVNSGRVTPRKKPFIPSS